MSEQEQVSETPQESTESHEMQMAKVHFESNPNEIPAQFGGNVDKFLDSWKEQRAALTRTQQELSEMKSETTEGGDSEWEYEEDNTPESLNIPEPETQTAPDEVWSGWEKEFVSTGDLSKETRDTIRDNHNIPDQVIDQYVAGLQASQAQAAASAASVVGGGPNLQSIIDWSAKNLSPEERDATNEALQKPGWQNVLLGLQSRMGGENPTKNEAGRGPVATNAVANQRVPYANQQEMAAALRDPRYGIDQEYTTHVQNRLRATNPGGTR